MLTQAPATPADNETFWSGLMAMIRALVLGRRLPPDQLRMFLLFAPPVPGLTPADIGRLLNWASKANWGPFYDPPDFEGRLPKGWTVLDELWVDEESTASRWDFEVCAATLIQGAEQRGWQKGEDWQILHAESGVYGDGLPYLCYRVLNERGELAPIAVWMEARRQLMRDNAFADEVPEDIRRANTVTFLEYAVLGLFDTWIHDYEEGDEGYAIAKDLQDVENSESHLQEIAEWVYDHKLVDENYYVGPDTGIEAVHKACAALGLFKKAKPKRKKQELFAA